MLPNFFGQVLQVLEKGQGCQAMIEAPILDKSLPFLLEPELLCVPFDISTL